MNKKDYKKYQENLSKVKKILKYERDLRRVFGENQLRIIRKGLKIMETQMEKLAKDKSVQASDEDKSTIKEVTNIFLNIAVNQPIVPIFRDLALNWLLLAFNWNLALGKLPDIEQNIKATEAIVRGEMTIVDAINTLKSLLERAKSLSQYTPPVFELSRHYLESLKEKIVSEKEKECLEEKKEEKLEKRNQRKKKGKRKKK